MEKITLTEARFRKIFSGISDCSYKYENGKEVVYHTLYRKIDNDFNLSYHLEFPQKNVKFNFWFKKSSYYNSNEEVTISFYNRNEKFEKDRLKNILRTNCLNELKEKLNDLFIQYN